MTRFALYFLRWQLSTPVLAVVIWLMADWPGWVSAAVANAVGACMFYWVDRWIIGANKPTAKSEIDFLLADKKELEGMLADLPESSAIDRLSIEARLESVKQKLKALGR